MVIPVVPIGNSRGIRLPKLVLDTFFIKDKIDMEITETGIVLTPITEAPRTGWAEAFCNMHENKEDVLDDSIVPESFEWEW